MSRFAPGRYVLLATIVVVSTLTGCARNHADFDGKAEQALFSDPFLYCQTNTNVDTPGDDYSGPVLTDAMLRELVRRNVISAEAPPEIQRNATWRCMDHDLWVCHFGANLPCLVKADTSQNPSPGMIAYCRENPAATTIPAAVTGRATVYEWQCRQGQPDHGRQLLTVDPRGYLAEYWYKVAPDR